VSGFVPMDHFRFFPDLLRGGSLARGFRRDQDLLRDRLVKVLYGEASILYFLAELNEFSNLGKGHEAMKVPHAKKWQKETDKLRQIALGCDLTEELKWGKPCFTFLKKNVAIVIPLNESCALSVLKGALLKDPKHLLQRIGEHTEAGRWIKFTSLRDIAAVRSTLKDYLYEAIELEESRTKIALKKPSDHAIPEELQRRLDDNAILRSAFEMLTPGRRKSYTFYVSSAKQAKTRAARAEKSVPMILSGRRFHELPN
jgi:uncharacterized protein YdeI (YjbR/CyaY-like superfamily)